MNTSRATRLAVVAMVAISMVAGFAGSAAAAGTVTASGLQDGDTITFTANASDTHTIQTDSWANDTSVAMKVVLNDSHRADGTIFHKNTTPTNVSAGSAGTTWNASFDEADLADVPMNYDQNVTVDVIVYNTSDTSDNVSISVTLDNEADRTVKYIGDQKVASSDDIETTNGSGVDLPIAGETSIPFYSDADKTDLVVQDVPVNSSDTTVVLSLGNETVADDFNNAFGDLDSEAWRTNSVGFVADDGARIYASAVPSDLDFDGSTVTYESDVGGTPALTVDLSDDVDSSQVDVEAYSDASFWQQADAYGYGVAAIGASAASLPLMGMLFVFARRRQEAS